MSPWNYFLLTQAVLLWFLNCKTCASALTSIVSCNFLDLLKPFDGTCFGHAFSKVLL